MVRWLIASFACVSIAWGVDSVRIVHSGRPFAPETVLPVMNRGYLFFINRSSPELDVYAPTGQLAFATTIQGPSGAIPNLTDAAIDDQGRVAVAIVYSGAKAVEGGIVLLDAAGKQTGLISTGRYMPSHLCFGPGAAIWTRGWQRDAIKTDREDRQDYFIIRRFSVQGQETGAFVKRSSFPPGLSPGDPWGGLWGIRAAGDRIGAFMYSGNTSERLVWLELDSSGNEQGRWTLPPGSTVGRAFTKKALYAVNQKSDREKRVTVWELDALDKDTSAWKPVSKVEYSWDHLRNCGMLMDADGEELVLAKEGGAILEWIQP